MTDILEWGLRAAPVLDLSCSHQMRNSHRERRPIGALLSRSMYPKAIVSSRWTSGSGLALQVENSFSWYAAQISRACLRV